MPNSKTDQEGQGAYAWLSPDTMRRITAWLKGAGITQKAVFRQIGVIRTKARDAQPFAALPAPPGFTWPLPAPEKLRAQPQPVLSSSTYIIGEDALTPAAVRLIVKRTARRAAQEHLVICSARNSTRPSPR